MRGFRLLAVLVVLSLLAVSLGSIAAQDDPIELTFYYPSAVGGNLEAVFQGYVEQFQEMHPDIVINVVYTGSYTQTRNTVMTEIQGGAIVADVAVMLASDLYSFVQEGALVPAQSYLDQEEDAAAWLENFYPSLLANGMDKDGVVWSIPFQRSTPIMYYNADLFEELGLDVPTNTEELVEVAQALKDELGEGFYLPVSGDFPIWNTEAFAAGFGQTLVEDDPTEVFFGTPEMLEAVTFMTKLGMPVEDGGYGVGPMGGAAWGDTPTAFIAGQVGMIYHTIGSLSNILANAEFEVGTAFLASGPAGEDGTGYAAVTGGGNLYIFDKGDEARQAAAWEWAKFLASDEIQADWGVATGYIASTYGAWETEPLVSRVEEYPQYGVARDQLEVAVKEFSGWDSANISANIINPTLSSILSGEVSLDEAQAVLENAQEQIDQLLAPYAARAD